MKTTVVTGLLGAGKTTFIQSFLKQSMEKAVVLVNDFGQSGIDGEIYSSGGIDYIELPSGCVCCTLRADLITAVRKIIADFSPEHLVIEPSGIASPSGVIEALDALLLKQVAVIGIVDATEFVELYESRIYGTFFEDQISNADIILINKTDVADESRISATERVLKGLNRQAAIVRTVRGEISGPMPVLSGDRKQIKKGDCHFRFDTIYVKLPEGTDFSLLEIFFEDMKRGRYGDVVRAKSLVQTTRGPYRFDLSYGKADKNIFEGIVSESRLIMIGENLQEDAVRNLFVGAV